MAAFGAKHSVGRRLHTVLTSSSVSGAAATSSSAVCTPPPIHWSHWKLTSRNMSSATWQHTVTMDNLNPCIKSMEYAVRGPLVIRATERKIATTMSCLMITHWSSSGFSWCKDFLIDDFDDQSFDQVDHHQYIMTKSSPGFFLGSEEQITSMRATLTAFSAAALTLGPR